MLRGASAEAQAELTSELESSRGDAEKLGEELFGVAAVLRGEPALRRIVTDASIESEAKAALAGDVFGNALSDTTLKLVKSAVQRRWTASHDLADVIEDLGVLAAVRSAGNDGNTISDELFEVRRVVDQTPGLRTALSDPSRSVADKGGLLRTLFGGKLLPATMLLVEQAAGGTHGAIDGALEDFQHTAAHAIGEKIATVYAARELSDGERSRLADALGAQYDTAIHLVVVLDPEIVGGVRVEIGDDVIDGTVASKLEDAQRKLAG
jgi:F-type H+-transporting ATPase subunit delta